MSPPPDDPPPLFGSWGRVYAAVLAWAVLVIAAVGAFSRWRF